MAQKALEQDKGTPYHHQLEMAFEKLTSGMRDKISFTPVANLAAVSFHTFGPGRADYASSSATFTPPRAPNWCRRSFGPHWKRENW